MTITAGPGSSGTASLVEDSTTSATITASKGTATVYSGGQSTLDGATDPVNLVEDGNIDVEVETPGLTIQGSHGSAASMTGTSWGFASGRVYILQDSVMGLDLSDSNQHQVKSSVDGTAAGGGLFNTGADTSTSQELMADTHSFDTKTFVSLASLDFGTTLGGATSLTIIDSVRKQVDNLRSELHGNLSRMSIRDSRTADTMVMLQEQYGQALDADVGDEMRELQSARVKEVAALATLKHAIKSPSTAGSLIHDTEKYTKSLRPGATATLPKSKAFQAYSRLSKKR
jgi:flagellin-like hook-associated protein FlgL